MRARFGAFAVVAALTLAACGGGGGGAGRGRPGEAAVAHLSGIEQLKADFNAQEGTARVVLLVSPT